MKSGDRDTLLFIVVALFMLLVFGIAASCSGELVH